MQIKHDVDIVTGGLTHGRNTARRVLQCGRALDHLGNRNGQGLHGRETSFQALARAVGELLGLRALVDGLEVPAAQMVVKTQRVAHGTAEQLANRLPHFFALDVPERLVDAANGAHIADAGTPKILAMHDLPQMFDAARVLTDQQHRNVFDRAGDGLGFPLERGFAPAVKAGLIGFHLHEDPVAHACIHDHGGNSCDFHSRPIRNPVMLT